MRGGSATSNHFAPERPFRQQASDFGESRPLVLRHNADVRIEIRQETIAELAWYASIPIAFDVSEVFEVTTESDASQFALATRRVADGYVKDYDAVGDGGPVQWSRRFDLSKWAFFAAFIDGKRVGGATMAYDTPGLDMLEGRGDLAVLWDIRVAPSSRRHGVGTALFGTAVTWASDAGARQLKVETQNINVAACRFYARNGCILRAVRPGVYPEFPAEIQLLWYKDLPSHTAAG